MVSGQNHFQLLLEQQALKSPELIAVEDGETVLTFSELLQAVKTRTKYVTSVAQDFRDETFLPVLVDKSVDSVVNIFACLAGMVPFGIVDSNAPLPRLKALHKLLGNSPCVLANPRLPKSEISAAVAYHKPSLDFADCQWASLDAADTDPGLVLTTSGSTGTPKGVVWSHRIVVERMAVAASRIHWVDGQARTPVLNPLHFVGGLTLVAMAMYGVKLTLLDTSTLSPSHLLKTLVELNPTQMVLTPQMARVLSALVSSDDLLFPDLVKISTGADVGRFEYFHGLRRSVAPTVILNQIFGSSEAAQSFTFSVPMGEIPREGLIPLGQLRDADDIHLEPVDDERFELWRTGNILSKYLRNDELNDKHFYTDGSGVRWWKSSDVIRKTPDGEWFFDSRLDDTVKIRGMFASPSEANALLQSHPAVSASVVMSEERAGVTRFVAHVEKLPHVTLSSAELRKYLERALPDHLVPARIVVHDNLPINERGKVDRAALREFSPGQR